MCRTWTQPSSPGSHAALPGPSRSLAHSQGQRWRPQTCAAGPRRHRSHRPHPARKRRPAPLSGGGHHRWISDTMWQHGRLGESYVPAKERRHGVGRDARLSRAQSLGVSRAATSPAPRETFAKHSWHALPAPTAATEVQGRSVAAFPEQGGAFAHFRLSQAMAMRVQASARSTDAAESRHSPLSAAPRAHTSTVSLRVHIIYHVRRVGRVHRERRDAASWGQFP